MTNQIIILAAGKGTRMNSHLPKVLVNFKGKPLILHLLEQVNEIPQVTKPIIVVGFGKDLVREFLGEGYAYAVQEEQLGTAHAVKAAKEKVKAKNVLVLYGDMPFIKAESLKNLLKTHNRDQNKITMFTTKAASFEGSFKSLQSYGRIVRTNTGQMEKIVEYKDCTVEQKKILEVNPGIYVFDSQWLWDNIGKIQNQNTQGEYYLTDLVAIALAQGTDVFSEYLEPKEAFGVNSLEDLLVAEKISQS